MIASRWMTETKNISQPLFSSLLLVFVCALALPACVPELSQNTDSAQEPVAEQTPDPEQAPDSEQPGAEQAPGPEPGAENLDPEQAFPTGSGSITEVTFAGRTVEVEKVNGEFVYEGDILLPPDMVITEPVVPVVEPGGEVVLEPVEEGDTTIHSLTARTRAHWEGGVVPYSIDPSMPNQSRITDAIAHWEANTNLVFKERTTERDYVDFQPSGGCSSYIGKIGGRQSIFLGNYCTTGNTIHEIGHAIGLWHEQSRIDRGDHIVINWDNIRAGAEHNFQSYEEQGWDGDEYSEALDFGSIMMYGSYSFSRNGQPTIVKLNGDTYSIQRNGLSADDIEGINELYPADGGEPEYVNGQMYTIAGLTVLRYHDLWYFYTRYGWKQVEYRDGQWWYA